MLNPGMKLDDRYEIVEAVGSGGMSIVFKAKDYKLKRYVAIKVLKPEFSQDMNFVSKFRVEAQASASLAHPNIVNVYDVSEDQGYHFIVMELVEGITLKEYITLNGRLSMDQAIDFSIQIASGLEAAHENHVIHRDIKPQNIIVSKNGNLKVTDFGIAKAATSNTMSTMGMGSVHYISPEQARGGYSDERSDIYSLGITMYEMVTARVPFEGDTNVSIALMHIQNDIIPPRQYFPDIYSSFEKIIMKATQKKPEKRYLTANALIADLKRVKANPNIDIIVAKGQSVVNNAPTQRFTPEDMKTIKQNSAQKEFDEFDEFGGASQNDFSQQVQRSTSQAGAGQRPVQRNISSAPQPDRGRINEMFVDDDDFDDDYYEPEYDEPVPVQPKKKSIKRVEDDYDDDYGYGDDYDDYDDYDDDDDSKVEKAVMIAGIAVAVILAIIILIVVGKLMGWFRFGSGNTQNSTSGYVSEDTEEASSEETYEMIDVVGTSEEACKKLLEKKKITNYEIVYEASEERPKGYVISQSVEEGTEVSSSTKIIITVSGGAELKKVPTVAGLSDSAAVGILEGEEYGFKVTHSFEASDTVAKDVVIRTEPGEGQEVPKGTTIVLVISNGPDVKTVAVPKVTGITLDAAKASIEAVNLTVGEITYEYSDKVENGLVIRQGISAKTTVNEGTAIDLVVSQGKKASVYTGELTGTVQCTNEAALENAASFVVECYMTVGGSRNAVFSRTIGSLAEFPLSVSGTLTDLSVNSGETSFSVTANMYDSEENTTDMIDVTDCFSANLQVSFKEQ